MKVNITLDFADGSKSKLATCNIEDLPMGELRMMMMQAGCMGVTITKADVLGYGLKHMLKDLKSR